MSGELELKRFGRYLILDHLVDGGMARICRARYLGEQADKIVAIKMIRTQYSQNPSFKKMFMDEIKVTFGLIHPNIAQTYDYGILDGQLYTAMEYVDGKNLKQFLEKLKMRKYIFPIEISTYVISQVCQALSYAHNFTDKLTGKSLNIIHRDISPHNIMLTYDGSVKVIDFGIAKANTNTEETQAGTIKGKLSYLAPEYLDGVTLDHTYDQFAVGVTLWEMLCGRKLFHADNEIAVLKQIQKCKVPPPSSINKKITKEMDEIVLRALSKQRSSRYENMDQLNRALVKYLYSSYPDFNASDLNYFAKELFKEDIAKDKQKFVEFGKVDIAPFMDELKKVLDGKSEEVASPVATKIEESSSINSKGKVLELLMDEDEATKEITKKISMSIPDKKDRISLTSKNKIVKTKYSANGGDDSDATSRTITPKAKKVKKGISNSAFVIITIALIGFSYWGVSNFDMLEKLIFSKKYSPQERSISSLDQKEINNNIKNSKMIIFLNKNPYQKFYINNALVDIGAKGLEITMYQNILLRVEQDGRIPIFMNFQITENSSDFIELPSAREGRFGILDTNATVFTGKKLKYFIDGNELEIKLPAYDLKIPVGKYSGMIIDEENETSKEVSFTIEEDTITKLPN